MAEFGQGTEKPTPKRLEKAREEGQVAVSPEVSPVAVLFTALLIGTWWMPALLQRERALLRGWLAAVGPMAARGDVDWPRLGHGALELGSLLVPFFFATAAVGTTAVVAQVGWNPRPQSILPKLEKLSLAKGLQRVFSAGGAMNLLKAVVKIVAVGAIAYGTIKAGTLAAVAAPAMRVDEILTLAGADVGRLLRTMAVALAVVSGLDYFWLRWRHEQSLMMTPSEVKDEARQSEGNPQVRGRFRKAHKEIAKRRMLADVARADVVLTNPTHVAVALRYRAEEGAAPRVLAKGAEEMAQRIKDAARRAGVPIVERRALARALFRAVEVGSEVPPNLYRAVAEILAYVYSLRGLRAEVR
ncbi:MAG: EscU/YscU/HrcU family type III secretion system export apparatus switch protein [Candidatus Binatia bacterium]